MWRQQLTLNDEAVQYWLAALEAEGRSLETLKTYHSHLRVFLRLLGERELNAFSFRSVFAEYRQGRAARSARSVYESVRAFINFMAREGAMDKSILTAMRPPKAPEVEKPVYSQGQLRALFQALSSDKKATGLRDYALCAVLTDGGFRVGEVCALRLDSLQPEGFIRLVTPKTGRVKSVPLGKRALSAVYRYLSAGRPRLKPKGESLFLTDDGRALTRNTVRLMLERRSKAVGFRLSAHRFRHTWATNALKATRDLETVRRIGGWASFNSLKPYLHMVAGDLDGASVLDRL